MLIEHDWKPGVWIDGDVSLNAAHADDFGAFAHHVHDDLITAQAAGRIPDHVGITVSASTIRPLWGDAPDVWFLHIRFVGLPAPEDAASRAEVATETFAVLDRRGSGELAPDRFGLYSGSLFFVDDLGHPRHGRSHRLYPPSKVGPL
ncbi:hypothetical protein [Amycolatopsis sp. WQ 127309]|uniref:hypothetical protein n=1 Tax=Amycolatopsis sp. WQ 127309 TaxID=2932773 RepID=UPI001FF3475D|nr:hypothetical protein [Amycolatopsis sp. WQ 127309]UOZ03415.1 hypothetical protein MUY22_31735 [Amycolatopsis sp. WQ 127309]